MTSGSSGGVDSGAISKGSNSPSAEDRRKRERNVDTVILIASVYFPCNNLQVRRGTLPSSLKASPIVAGACALAVELVKPQSPRPLLSSNG